MTGDCRSDRALELTPKSYVRIGLNGNSFNSQSYARGKLYTPLEKYLYMVKSPMHEQIIAYLKGDIQEIVLK